MEKTYWVVFKHLDGDETKWITDNRYHVGDKLLTGRCHLIEVTDFSVIYHFKEEE